MNFSRRDFFRNTMGLVFLSPLMFPAKARGSTFHFGPQHQDTELPSWSFPELSATIKDAVGIRSVELLQTQGQLLLVVTSNDGIKGITQCNDRMPNLTSLLKGLVIRHFEGKDARDLPE